MHTTTYNRAILHTNSPLHTHINHLLFVLQFAVSNMIAICFITLFLLSVALTLSIGLYFFCIIFLDTHFAYHFVSTAHSHTHYVCLSAGIAFAPGSSWVRLSCFHSHTPYTPASCLEIPTLLSLWQCSVAAMPCGVYFFCLRTASRWAAPLNMRFYLLLCFQMFL